MSKHCILTVIVNYIPSEGIHKCLASLESQTLKGMEVILITNRTVNDKTNKFLNYFLQRNSNFRTIPNEKKGTNECGIKRAILEAKGEYIGFLDETIHASPHAFETLYHSAKKFNCDIAVSDCNETLDDKIPHKIIEINSGKINTLIGNDFFDIVISMIKKPFNLRTKLSNKIFKKDAILTKIYDLINPNINEDTITLLASLSSTRAAIIDEKLFTIISKKDIFYSIEAEKNIDNLIYSFRFFREHVLHKGISNTSYETLIQLFFFHIFNENIKLSLLLEKEKSASFLNNLIKRINENIDVKKDFYRYINNKNRNEERLLLSTINNSKQESILQLAENTEIFFRKEGGMRLTDRSKYAKNIKKMVTVVTICKNIFIENRKKYFDKMLSSVVNQTYGREHIEHIIIDGNSTDETVEYIKSLSENGVIDHWISENDNGVYHAMNKGVKYSFGDYIIFMNSDDYFAQNAIEDLVNIIEELKTDYAYANAIIIDEHDNHIGSHIGDINKIYFGSPYCHQTLLCKASCFWKVKFDESYRITMWSYALSLFMEELQGSHVNKDLAFFRFGGISTNNSHAIKFKNEQTKIKKEIVIPKLGIDINEYDFLHSLLNHSEADQKEINIKKLHKKLIGMSLNGNKFQNKYAEIMLPIISNDINNFYH